MTRDKSTLIRFADLEKGRIEAIIEQLNDPPSSHRDELRRLFEAWARAGRDVRKMLQDPAVKDDLSPYVWGKKGVPLWRASMIPVGSGLRAMLDPTFVDNEPKASKEEFLRSEARGDFASILINEFRERISERPCQRCGHYFWKRRSTHQRICGRACLREVRIEAAKKATFSKNKEMHRRQIERARLAMEQWSKLKRRPRNQTWQQWVSARCPEITEQAQIDGSWRRLILPAITKKFLTRNKLTL
jgi:hypothetical protein